MNIIGQTLELTIPGRWGSAIRRDVIVQDAFQANEGRFYLRAESINGEISYLLTNRYDNDRVDQLEPGKMMMVVIGRQKEDVNIREFSRLSKTEDYFAYAGGGTIQILDVELENLRRGRSGDGGMLGPLVNLIERMLGRKNG
jgi:hypothetical protein